MSDQVAWGDTLATWPSLSVEVEFMPWHWRLGWWRRDGAPGMAATSRPVDGRELGEPSAVPGQAPCGVPVTGSGVTPDQHCPIPSHPDRRHWHYGFAGAHWCADPNSGLLYQDGDDRGPSYAKTPTPARPTPTVGVTPEKAAEWAALAEAATAGPWQVWAMEVLADPVGDSNLDTALPIAHTNDPHRGLRTFNADFIAAAREAVPALLAERAELLAEVEQAKTAQARIVARFSMSEEFKKRQALEVENDRLREQWYAEAAVLVEHLCHWVQDRGNARTETHEQFHFLNPCPYAAMAAVLRGEPDPRDTATEPARGAGQ